MKLARTLLDEDPRAAVDCYRAVASASSAIPIAFPPRFVDGRMLVDGGARWHMFLAAAQPGEARGRHPARVHAFVHGSLDVGRLPPRDGVLQVAERTSRVWLDLEGVFAAPEGCAMERRVGQ